MTDKKREPPLLRMVLEQIRIILIEKHIARKYSNFKITD